jgi:hypothetical protein
MKGRSAISECCERHVAFKSQRVFDRRVVRPLLATVRHHVRPDLAKGALEKHHVRVVHRARHPVAQQLHRMVESVERIVELRQAGVELERLDKVRSQ